MKNIDSVSRQQKTKPPVVTIGQKQQVNLLSQAPSRAGKAKTALKTLLILILASAFVLGGVVAARTADLSSKVFVGQKTTFFDKIKDVLKSGGGSVKLVGEDLGQVNVLLLGIGGEGHDGPFLSDSIILAQIRPDIGQIAMTSIPRDYLAEMPDNRGKRKINAVFAEGYYKNKDWNEAGRYAREAVGKIAGLEIPYFAVVDFAGFQKAIDEVGGIDIDIERSFTDYQFPDDRLVGYLPPVSFTKGTEKMNGKRALQFARSRHAAGPEGSDFARSQRQQKIIKAFKDKATSVHTLTDPGKIGRLMGVFADHFHTNISPGEIFRIYRLVKEKDIKDFTSLSLDPQTKLVCPQILEENGAYVLLPCPGKSPKDVQNFFKNAFALGKLYEERAVIWLANSGSDKKTYQEADKKLKEAGLTVWELPYSGTPLPETVIYQANPAPATAEYVKNSLKALEATLPPPGVKADKEKVDIIIILGTAASGGQAASQEN